ncbi:PfkB family carbohydrate kinase [Klebsiella pneumoniae subsp. pneumoniae]|nr:PfkB family carbohydrate kinase [Klebsiella pneumoniae subsp. pneumoniae]
MDASGKRSGGAATDVKARAHVGAGDSMVGAMTLRLAENASLEDMVRFGVAAGSAATINRGTRLCSRANTQKNL